MSFYVGVAQCELFAAQFDNKVPLFEIFELIPLGDNCLSIGNLGLRKTFL